MTPRPLLPTALALLLAACGNGGGEAARGGAPRPVPVHVAQVSVKDVPVEVQAIGKIVSNQSVAIRPQVSGPIVAVHFSEGQPVRKGDLLVEIDRRPYQAAAAAARAKLAEDRVRAENARSDQKRFAELVEKEFVTRQQYDAAKANAAALDATVLASQAALQRAELDLSYCSIRAPIAGRTGRLLVQQGNLVSAGGADPLLTIEQLRPVFAAFSLPSAHLGVLRGAGRPVTVRIRAPGVPEVEGTVAFVDNAVDAATGTILVKARVENADEALWPGLTVQVIVRLAERSGAVVVPVAAVATGQQGDYAYVVTDKKTVELRPVKVGLAGEDEAVIDSGLRPGETVVTEGFLKLRPGAAIEVLAAKREGPRS